MPRISLKQFKDSLNKAKEFFEKYKSRGNGINGFPRDVDVLADVCHLELEAQITVCDLPKVPDELKEYISGTYFKRNDKTFEIYLAPNLNECWTRFVQCKELFHVLLDEQEFRSVELNSHLEQLERSTLVSIPEIVDEDGEAFLHLPGSSEQMAQIAAMEFLFPYSERLDRLKEKQPIFYDIAYRYRIPKIFVQAYLSDEMMDLFKPYS